MKSSIARSWAASMLLGLSMLAAIPAGAQSATTASAQEDKRLQLLIEAAKKEGELTFYHVTTPPSIMPIIDAFTKKYGIKVKTWRSSTENVVGRIIKEGRAGRAGADIVENNAPEMEALHREKLLRQVDSPHHRSLMPQAIPAHREWVGNNIDIFVQAYNTDQVKKEELPQSYQDLLDPKWKGRLGIESEDHHWFAMVLQELGPEKGMKLFKEIVATNGISVRKGHTLLAQMVGSGEVPLGLTVYNNMPLILKKKGAPIDWFIIPPAIAAFRGIGVLGNAAHPNAAMLFYDFMLSEGQQVLAGQDYVVTSNRIDAPLKKMPLKFVDPGLTLDMQDKWIKDYDEAIKKGMKQ
ncbi:MAG: fbpA 3 [Noviherbaspirillum sp.]|jgi:iron(III) transport system substrate-binding protein|nr:fbpA 3 [Noviherbaspirillum sp.]MDB5795014.1 fbpA 3 [Noviherbaspirillum sp.]